MPLGKPNRCRIGIQCRQPEISGDPRTLFLLSQKEGLLGWHSLPDLKESTNALRMQEPVDRANGWGLYILKIKFAPGPFGLASNGRAKALIYGKRILNQ